MTIQRLGILIPLALLLTVLPARADCGYGDRDELCGVH